MYHYSESEDVTVAVYMYLIYAAGHVRFEVRQLFVMLYGSSSDYIHDCMLCQTFGLYLIMFHIYSHVR